MQRRNHFSTRRSFLVTLCWILGIPHTILVMTTGTATDKIGQGIYSWNFLPVVCDGVLQVKFLAYHLEQSQFEVLQPVVTNQITDVVLIKYNGIFQVHSKKNIFSCLVKVCLLRRRANILFSSYYLLANLCWHPGKILLSSLPLKLQTSCTLQLYLPNDNSQHYPDAKRPSLSLDAPTWVSE